MGTLIDRVHRELTDTDLEKIVSTYHACRGDESGSARAPRAVSGALAGNSSSTGEAAHSKSPARAPKTTREGASAPHYSDIPGLCKSATTPKIAALGHVLTPSRYVGAEEKMPRLVAELHAHRHAGNANSISALVSSKNATTCSFLTVGKSSKNSSIV